MKHIAFLSFLLFATVGVSQAQAPKEEELMRSFFDSWKNNDKKSLTNVLLKESDLDAYNASQKALGSTKVMSKGDFEKFVDEKNKKILREFDELRKSAGESKITFPDTKYSSYKKMDEPNAEVPAGFYKLYFRFHDTYTFKIQLECVPVGDGFRLFNLLEDVSM